MPEWFVIESARRIHPLQMATFYRYWGQVLRVDGAISFEERDSHFLFRRDQFDAKAKWAFEKLKKDPAWFAGLHREIRVKAKAYRQTAERLAKTDFSPKSNAELAKLFKAYFRPYSASHRSGQIDNLLEMEHEYLSNHVKSILAKQIQKRKLSVGLGEAFNLISLPDEQTETQRQEKDFLRLAVKLLKKPATAQIFRLNDPREIEAELTVKDRAFARALDSHFERYKWLPFMYEGPAWEKSYFVNLLASLVKQGKGLKTLEENLKEEKKMMAERERLLKALALKGRDKKFVLFVPESIYLKGLRKEQMYFGCFVAERLFREIGKRLGLSLDQVRYFMPEEVLPALLKGRFDPEVLNQRFKFGVYRIIGGKEDFLVGERARKFFSQIYKEEKYDEIKELKGSCAFAGQAKGRARVINHPGEMYALQEGEIMVSHSTNPNLLPAMKKAGAIVTDIGGITCHAAIVSRELKKPCVIGTKIATKVLSDGDLIEVDAQEGVIKKVTK